MLSCATTCSSAVSSNRVEAAKGVRLNEDGSYFSNAQIYGKSKGPLALSPDERKSFEKSGWHDTGLINGHGQPIVQNDKGLMLSVCRLPIVNSVCGGYK